MAGARVGYSLGMAALVFSLDSIFNLESPHLSYGPHTFEPEMVEDLMLISKMISM